MVILQDVYNLRSFSRDLLFRLVFRGVAVVLQLIFFITILRVAGFVVSILIRVVVGQGHLSKLLLRGERLSARLEVLQTDMIKLILKMLHLGEPSYKENWFFLDIFRKGGGGVSSNPKFP